MDSATSSAMLTPSAKVEPNRRHPFPIPHNWEIKEKPLQCVKVYARAAPAEASESTTSHVTPVSCRKTGRSVTKPRNRKSEPLQAQKVLPSVEHPPKKRLESGIEYSARKCMVGAGKMVEDSAVNNTVLTNILPSRRSTSISDHELNSDMGKERDELWQPSLEDTRHAQRTPRPVSEPDPNTHDSALPTRHSNHGDATLEIVDLEASPSLSSSSSPAAKDMKCEFEDGEQLPRQASPLIWNSELRCRILKQEGIVEVPKEIVEYEYTTERFLAQWKLIKACEREAKGKAPERDAGGPTECSTSKDVKRKAKEEDDDDETMELRKTRKKADKHTHENGKGSRSSFDNTGYALESKDQVTPIETDKRQSHSNRARRAESGYMKRQSKDNHETMNPRTNPMKAEKQTYEDKFNDHSSSANTKLVLQSTYQATSTQPEGGLSHSNKACKGGSQAPHNTPQKQHQHTQHTSSRKRATNYERFHVPKPPREPCTCQLLPDYFTKETEVVPSLTSWSGSKLEFLVHIDQISSCPGHSRFVRDACRRILETEKFLDMLGLDPTISFAQGCSTSTKPTNTRDHPRGPQPLANLNNNRTRATPTHPSSNNFRSGVQTRTQMHQVILSLPNSLPIGQRAKVGRVSSIGSARNATSTSQSSSRPSAGSLHPQPPTSPLAKGPRDSTVAPDEQFEDKTRNDDLEAGHILPLTTLATFPANSQPRTPFSDQQKRHQSAPAPSIRRKDKRSPVAQETRRQGATELLAANSTISGSDALLYGFNASLKRLERVVDTLQKTPNGQSNQIQQVVNPPVAPAPVAPAPAPAPPPPPASAVTGDGQPAQKKRKTTAERKAAGRPELDKNVPHHDRLPDQMLLEIGKDTDGYQRHKQAPYAFSWKGRLYTDHRRLLTARDQQGNQIWDCEVIKRVRP